MVKVLLIIPAFNEEASIMSVAETVQGAGYDYVVVNDGSTDNTLNVCLENNINVLDRGCGQIVGPVLVQLFV